MRRVGQASAAVRWGFGLFLLVPLAAVFMPGCGRGGDSFEAERLPRSYREMLERVAAERGLAPPETIRIGTVPREKLSDVLGASEGTPASSREAAMSDVYSLLGLLPVGMDYSTAVRDSLERSAGAVYVPGRREVWLIRDGPLPASPDGLAPWEQRLLAHEFVHAIQDYHFDLDALERAVDSIDSWLALHALLEGDAVWTASRWTASALMPSLVDATALEPPSAALPPPALGREFAFMYVSGAEWVALLRGRDPEAVDRLLRAGGPSATARILHPDIDLTGWSFASPAVPSSVPSDDWQLEGTDRLGEFLLRSYLQTGLPSLAAAEAAEGWAGDSLLRYRAAGRRVLGLRVRFRDAKDAGEFAAAHLELLRMRAATFEVGAAMTTATRGDGVTVIQLAPLTDEVTIVYSDDSASAAVLAGFLLNR